MDAALAAAGLAPLARHAWVEVSLPALAGNVAALRRMAGPATAVAAVVKADAYGHGIEVTSRAARLAGATWLSVATLDEALLLRRHADTGRILVNYPAPKTRWVDAHAAGIDVVIGDVASAVEIAGMGAGSPRVHLEIDTGMGRGGVLPEDAVTAASILRAAGIELSGTWSHLAAPEDPVVTAGQVGAFEEVLAKLRADGIDPGLRHLDASGGILHGAPAYDLVRAGLALYGVLPPELAGSDGPAATLRPCLAVRAAPVRIADVPAGTPIGYGGTFVTSRLSRIATVPIGYADGWTRNAGPRTVAVAGDQVVPVVGRISSDSMTVDLTGTTVTADDPLTLLEAAPVGPVSADAVAGVRSTITWEVLQTLSHRLARVYLDGRGRPVAIRRHEAAGPEYTEGFEAAATGTEPEAG
ncbi:MAG: alanine racemase [Chloroflexota bacterium]